MRVMETFTPELDVARDFLDYICDDKEVCFRSFSDDPNIEVRPSLYYGKFDDISQRLVAANQHGCGIFWMVNASDGGQKSENITGVRALFIDMDGAPLDSVLECPVQPHAILETSPQRYHCYWLVNQMPLNQFSRYQKALSVKFQSDMIFDLPRVMRLPGFFHLKGRPFLSRVIRYTEMRKYDYEELGRALKLDVYPSATPEYFGTPLPRHPSFNPSGGVIPVGQRDTRLFSIACSARNAAMGHNEMLSHLSKLNDRMCETPLPLQQLEKIVRQAEKRESWAEVDLVPRSNSGFSQKAVLEPRSETDWVGAVKSLDVLETEDIAPLKWVIPDMLPQGLTILAGAPKMGKSLIVQQLSYCVAMGCVALKRFPVNQGAALHLALEDSPARFKGRMMLQKEGIHSGPAPKDCHFTNQWALLPEAITHIEKWCESQKNPKLVVIDTLAKLIDGTKVSSQNAYNSDYQMMGAFHKLALDYGIAVVVVHHLRKADTTDPMMAISGSVGLTGSADLVWAFTRKSRDQMSAKLQAMGKDLGDTTYQLDYDPEHMLWTCENYVSPDAENVIGFLLKDYFKKVGSAEFTVSEVASTLNRSKTHITNAIRRLASERFLMRKEDWKGNVTYCQNPDVMF